MIQHLAKNRSLVCCGRVWTVRAAMELIYAMQQSGWKIGGGPNTDPTRTGHISGGIWGLGTKNKLYNLQLCLTSFFAVVIITKATGGCRSTRNVNKGLSRLISSWPNVASDFRKPSFQHSPHLHLHTEGSLLCPGPPESRYSSYNDIYSVKMTTTGLLLHGKEEATPVPH